jgi:hypothetical protein
MAGGPIFPSSEYLGGASGYLASAVYIPATNTNGGGAIEGIGVVASLTADAPAVLQFNLPEVIPSGTMKLRTLAWANASAGAAKFIVTDGQTNVGSNIGATTLNPGSPSTQTLTWSAADVIMENKLSLTTTPTVNYILTVLVTFQTASWGLAQNSVWQFSLVWE